MNDIKHEFISDIAEKKKVAHSSGHKKGCSRRITFPSDFMTKKELQKMNGPEQTFNLSKPMTWAQFKQLPQDLKFKYIKDLEDKYSLSQSDFAQMLGAPYKTVWSSLSKMGYFFKNKVTPKEELRRFKSEFCNQDLKQQAYKTEEPKMDDQARPMQVLTQNFSIRGNYSAANMLDLLSKFTAEGQAVEIEVSIKPIL